MRRAVVTFLLVVPLACGPRAEDGDEPAPPDTTPSDTTVRPPEDGPGVSGTAMPGEAFDLAWPNRNAARACIHIPAGTIDEPTEVSIDKLIEVPPGFRQGGRPVFSNAFEFTADPPIPENGDPDDDLTIGLCAFVDPHEHDPYHDPDARVARLTPNDEVQEFRIAHPCYLRCSDYIGRPPSSPGSASTQTSLLDGTVLSPTTLHAEGAMAEEGIGGKGGGLSPFAVVGPEGAAGSGTEASPEQGAAN